MAHGSRWHLTIGLTACSEIPGLAEAGPEAQFGVTAIETATAEHEGDFVWAVRLAKITKNGLQKTWGMETVTGRVSGLGAVFNTEAGELEEEDVWEVVCAHGLDADVLKDPESGCVFVVS